jgi:hypothetical protein
VEFVIIDYQKGISKVWYEKGYTDGDAEAPDCFSHDGKDPNPQSRNKQANSCVTCPKNQWGSRITDAGKKAKACRDSKRLAVSFATNIDNPELGGPMLLRIPAQSLKDLDRFAAGMTAKGFVPQQIVTRISFDVNASYPKLMFKAVRPLSDEELQLVQKWYHSEQVRDILEGQQHSTQVQAIVNDTAPEPVKVIDTVDTEFEQPAPSPAPSQAPSAPKLEAVKSEPVKEEKPAKTSSTVDADLDAIIGDLDIG